MLYKINRDSGIPLIGTIFMGVIDRGSNLLQIRPTTVCNIDCQFCSTHISDPKLRPNHFIIDIDYLYETIKEIVEYKNTDIIAFFESVGEPTTYPKLAELIKRVKQLPQVKRTAMVTNGTLLTDNLLKNLEGNLDQINISIHALDEALAKTLAGSPYYSVKKIIESIKKIKNIEVWLTPVWLPGVNDHEMPKLIAFAKEHNLKIGIQKYDIYKYSRKMKRAKMVNYYHFYKQLTKWEKDFNYKLKIGPSTFKIERTKALPLTFQNGDIITARIKAQSWLRNQVIAVAKNRAIAIDNCDLPIESEVKVRITQNRNNIYLANLLKPQRIPIQEAIC